MQDYQRKRDEAVLPMYEMTCGLATLAPPPPEMLALFAALPGNQNAVDAFVQMNAGTISPRAFLLAGKPTIDYRRAAARELR